MSSPNSNDIKIKTEVEEEVEASLQWIHDSGYAQAQEQRNSVGEGIFGFVVDSLHSFQQAYDFEAKEFRAVSTPGNLDYCGNYKLKDLNSNELDRAAKDFWYHLDRFPKTKFSKYARTSYNRKSYTG